MFGWLTKKTKKEDFDRHKDAVQTALNSVKQDMGNIGVRVKHLNDTNSGIKEEIRDLKLEINYIREELEGLKNVRDLEVVEKEEPLFKQTPTVRDKQTAVQAVQTTVQTAVQAAFFNRLSISERAIILILVNSDLKLSYEDLAAMTGKDSATIRGQINSIKQKCEGLIEEQIERNNKKRLFVPEKIKAMILKKVKIRGKKAQKEAEN